LKVRELKRTIPLLLILLIVCIAAIPAGAQELILYSGRSKSLVEPLIEQFRKETGITVRVRYGDTSQLAIALIEEGIRSPADVFWAQDGGALGVLSNRGLLADLPDTLHQLIPVYFRSNTDTWIATSGRARVVAYSPVRIDPGDIPQSIYDFTDPVWNGRFGWAPQNASFQTFISAMIERDGRGKVREWLAGIRRNNAKSYRSNVPILQAIAAGEIDAGITNHYYLIRFKQTDEQFPVEQTFLAPGDPANFMNVAGAGVLKTAKNKTEARRFIEYLLSHGSQRYFAREVYEYPVRKGIDPHPALLPLEELLPLLPDISIDQLDNLDSTLQLLREVGIL
jgi:iron(III) transport system substrate-binding protein